MPPLRHRREDIGPLAQFFCGYYARKINKRLEGLTEDLVQQLTNYEWKGNIRKLKNVIERAAILADGPLLTADLLPPEIRGTPGWIWKRVAGRGRKGPHSQRAGRY